MSGCKFQFERKYDAHYPDTPEMRDLALMQERMHHSVDNANGQRGWRYSAAQREKMTAAFVEKALAVDPGADPATLAEVAALLMDDRQKESLPAYSIDSREDEFAAGRDLDEELSVEGPEAALVDNADLSHGTEATGDPVGDRRFNFLYHELYVNQEQTTRSRSRFNTIFSFSEWMFARSLLVGCTRIPNFGMLLREKYPACPGLDVTAAKRLVHEDEALGWTDPNLLLSRLYNDVSGSREIIGAMVEGYCDAVRASRPKGEEPTLTDLPDVHRPRVSRDGVDPYRQRIHNVHELTQNKDWTARAFGTRNDPTFRALIA